MTANVGTTPSTISERDLAERLSEILDRVAGGEQFTIVQDGTAIALLGPPPEPKNWTWGEFVHWLKYEADFDEEFVKNVRELRKSQPPAGAVEWPE